MISTERIMTKIELFLELASPNKDGVSRWVNVNEFTGKYHQLKLGNGGSWNRKGSSITKKYIVEFDKSLTPGNSIDAIRLNGHNKTAVFSQSIRSDIKSYYYKQKCVMLGVAGFSVNTRIEVDHKDGRKNLERISNSATQRADDFQPLCKAANDVKRQICKICKRDNKRWDAKNIKGNPYSFYEGGIDYTEDLGCIGCYQYDPVEYRKSSTRKISQEASEFIMDKLYPEDK